MGQLAVNDEENVEIYYFKHYPYVIDGEAILKAIKYGKSRSITDATLESEEKKYLYIKFSDGLCDIKINLNTINLKRINDTYLYKVYCDNPEESLKPLALHTGHGFMRLYKPTGTKYVTLMIDGVLMHQTTRLTPIEDAERKISLLSVKKGHLVLDVCTGLGYTAITARRRGARVYTIEVSRHVLILASHNPYSKRLEDNMIHIINNDAVNAIKLLKDNVFHRIVHDPPRFSIAGELYSENFYRELYRVLRPGGILLHYVGKPLRSRGRGYGPIVRGVVERLRRVGFISTKYYEDVGAVIARKKGHKILL